MRESACARFEEIGAGTNGMVHAIRNARIEKRLKLALSFKKKIKIDKF